MTSSTHRLFRMLAAIGFGCIFFAGLSLGQTVTIAHKYNTGGTTVAATEDAPVDPSYIVASPSGTPLKVVLYKNDVPIATVTSAPFSVDLGELGQDSYVFRARAYYAGDVVVESTDLKFKAKSPKIHRMGSPIITSGPTVATSGPYRYGNHTLEIQNAVDAISADGGGTLFFPCTFGLRYPPTVISPILDNHSIYIINDTIKIPSNVTLQGEAAGDQGRCQIWWNVPNHAAVPPPLPCAAQAPNMSKPMFQIVGDSSHVRFKDLAFRAMGGGEQCYYGRDGDLIASDDTTAIELTTKLRVPKDSFMDGDVSDVIIENVAFTFFTRGISANSPTSTKDIHDVKIRGALAIANHRQMYINAPYVYDWDVQNFDAAAIGSGQGALEIVESGVPSGYTGDRGELRFVQLNCAGGPRRPIDSKSEFVEDVVPSTCITVSKHGGLYFKQSHFEGPKTAITVNDIHPQTNDAPIVFEASVVAGEFEDASMKLYTIGSYIPAAPETPQVTFWDAKMHFRGKGLLSKVVDCGNFHGDRTDTDGDPDDIPEWVDWTMQYTHSERQRPSYYDMTNGYAFRKEPIPCPMDRTDDIVDINTIGGAYFDSGILPTETTTPYSNIIDPCPAIECDLKTELAAVFSNTSNAGAVRIEGNWESSGEIEIPVGRMLVGINDATVNLMETNKSLFTRPLGVTMSPLQTIPASAIVMRDLKLIAWSQEGTTAIRFAGTGVCSWIAIDPAPIPDMNDPDCHVGVSTDIHFDRLTIEGFDIGIYGGRFEINSPEPMIDSIGLKNLKFVNNKTAVWMESSNASNWNTANLEITSNTTNAVGWLQILGAHQSFQSIKCSGSSGSAMATCLRLETTGAAVMDIRPGSHVSNMVLIESPFAGNGRITGSLLIRDSDLRSAVSKRSRFNMQGKAFITSINNRYQYVTVSTTNEGHKSRVTYCGDSFEGGPAFPDLDDLDDNLYFGIHLPTRTACQPNNGKPWQEPFKWGGKNSTDTPLAGNFFDDIREDFVVYQRDSSSRFIIRKGGDPGPTPSPTPVKEVILGSPTDIPFVGRFVASTPRSQVVAYTPGSTAVWHAKDPSTSSEYYFYLGTTGDVPFVGNFFKESGVATDQRDEIAIYRATGYEVRIQDPRNPSTSKTIYLGADKGSQIVVGDFLGVGNDQFAFFSPGIGSSTGSWYIVDPNPSIPTSTTVSGFGGVGDVAVAGKFLEQLSGYPHCAQLAVWHPGSGTYDAGEEEITIRDPSTACGNRGFYPNSPISYRWGSNNDYGSSTQADDIPLTISTANGQLDRFTAYRPTAGHFTFSNQNGLWFVHDPF